MWADSMLDAAGVASNCPWASLGIPRQAGLQSTRARRYPRNGLGAGGVSLTLWHCKIGLQPKLKRRIVPTWGAD